MKLVLSRKGFDSSAGGVASPILPDGRLKSLAIPDADSPQRYGELSDTAPSMASLVTDLAPRVGARDRVHLDPDLDASHADRHPGWRPAFGQAGAALGHLEKHGVGAGDLFLFFGWFRAVERVKRRWRFVPGAPDLHCLYGWLQIGDVIDLTRASPAPAWRTHVHCQRSFRGGNTLYIARPSLAVDGVDVDLPGGGVWRRLSAVRVLTARGKSRSHWSLPRAFAPRITVSGLDCLSYHTKAERWSVSRTRCALRVAPRGQEFVLDCHNRPGLATWLTAVFADG